MSSDSEPAERSTSEAHTLGVQSGPPRALPVWAFAAAPALLAALWALDRFVLHLSILTTFRGTAAASPLYAFWNPILRPEALVVVALAIAFVLLAPRATEPERTGRAAFVTLLLLAALLLPLATFLVRQDFGELGAPFRIYANEEFWDDALKLPLMRDAAGRTGVPVFLQHYVEAMPRLSLHGQHFPPGHALYLHAWASLFGATLPVAAASVLLTAACGLVLAFLALRELLDERAARQAGLLLAVSPSLLDFACTAMDAVFFAWAALALWTALRALRGNASALSALGAGAAFALASLASFAVLPLGLVIALYALVLAARRERATGFVARQLALVGAGFALGLAAVWLATGFAWWECLVHARESGLALMTRILKGPPSSRWAELSYGNGAAFALGAGAGVVALLVARGRPALPRDAWTLAAIGTLLVMALGGLFFMETERIWLFALPWLVAVAFTPGALRASSLRVVLALGLAQAIVLEAFLFTLW